jgi:VanZ family protein
LPSLVILVGIFIISDQPRVELPEMNIWQMDKFLHVIAYFVLGCTLAMAVEGNFKGSSQKAKIWMVVIIGALYAIEDEFHQSFVPGRSSDIFDILADFIGIGLSVLLFNKIADLIKRLKLSKH